MKGGLGTALIAGLGVLLLYLAATGKLNNVGAAWAALVQSGGGAVTPPAIGPARLTP